MAIRSLADADATCGAKAAGLARLIAAGLPVPDGFVLDAAAFAEVSQIDIADTGGRPPDSIGHVLEAAAQRIERAEIPATLAREVTERGAALGRLAVRSSASIEDGALGAAAGVFASLTDVAPEEVWRAVRAVWMSALTPLAVTYARHRAATVAMSVIVQRFVPGTRMTVYTRPIGQPSGDEIWLSVEGRSDDSDRSLDRVPRSSERPDAALALTAEAAIGAMQGADVELVIEPDGIQRWVVQARPIIHPARSPRSAPPPIVLAPLQDGQRWTWDIAHNPDPLSPAQAGLVDQIDRSSWSPVAMRVCGGYLYTAARAALAPPVPPADRAELVSRIAAIEARLAELLREDAVTVAGAVQRYVAFMQIWICELSPLVAAARRTLLDRLAEIGHPPERIPGLAASLIGPRRGPRDPVMSPAWDVAVPTFAETSTSARSAAVPDVSSTDQLAAHAAPPDLAVDIELARAAASAAEHDDLWFARAQWLVRRSLLNRAHELALRADDIFWIPLDDVITMRTLDPIDVHRRASAARAAHARAAEWDMPLSVPSDDACCESRRALRTTLRGVGIGSRRVGRVVRFASLAAARPVAADEVVVTRAVTPALAMIVDGCAALVSETGGLLDHGAALARELGIPCVVGCVGAWTQLGDGALVTVDGDAGVVTVE